MSIRERNVLKGWFKRGDKPLAAQFADWIDSFWHKNEKLPVTAVDGLAEAINSKAEKPLLDELENKMNEAVVEMDRTKERLELAIAQIDDDIAEHDADEEAHPFIRGRIDAEVQARVAADAALQTNAAALQNRLNPVVTEVGVASEPTTVKIVKTKRNAVDGADTTVQMPLPTASPTQTGLMSAADKTKLDGVAAGAEVNVQADWNVSDTGSDAFIKNKPAIPDGSVRTLTLTTSSLALTVDTNDYDVYDITLIPAIPEPDNSLIFIPRSNEVAIVKLRLQSDLSTPIAIKANAGGIYDLPHSGGEITSAGFYTVSFIGKDTVENSRAVTINYRMP